MGFLPTFLYFCIIPILYFQAQRDQGKKKKEERMGSYRWKTFFEEEDRPEKPRRYGVTEMRGPQHSLFSQNLLQVFFSFFGEESLLCVIRLSFSLISLF